MGTCPATSYEDGIRHFLPFLVYKRSSSAFARRGNFQQGSADKTSYRGMIVNTEKYDTMVSHFVSVLAI